MSITTTREIINGRNYTIKDYGENVWYSEIVYAFENLPYSLIKQYANEDDCCENVKLVVKIFKKNIISSYRPTKKYTHIMVYFDEKEVMNEDGDTSKFTPLFERLDLLEIDLIRNLDDERYDQKKLMKKVLEELKQKVRMNKKRPDVDETNCPICLEEYSRELCILKDSNDNHGILSECNHQFCCICLHRMYVADMNNCPLCRTDITELVGTYYDDDESDSYLQ